MFDLIHLLDSRAFVFILAWRVSWLEDMFLFITAFGAWYIAAVIAFLLAVYFWKKGYQPYIFPLVLSLAASSTTTFLLKHFIARPRPVGVALYIEDLSSFPSGHATVAAALYGFLTYFLYKKLSGAKRWFALVGGAFFILLIGFSRIYLGVHYLSDVAGGYLVGGAWLVGGILLARKMKE